jgi:hypothetical protein
MALSLSNRRHLHSLGIPALMMRSSAPNVPKRYKCASTHLARALVYGQHELSVVQNASAESLFPYKEKFIVDGAHLSAEEVIEYLTPLQTPERIQRVLDVCANRTFDIAPIIEGELQKPYHEYRFWYDMRHSDPFSP